MLSSSKSQLLLICFISVAAFSVVIFTSFTVLHTILAFIIGLFLPGYSLLLALYPRQGSLSGVERLLFSFALSLAVVTLLLFAVNYLWSLALLPSLVSVVVFTLLMTGIAWWRQRRLLPAERFTVPLPVPGSLKLTSIFGSIRFYLWLALIALTIILLSSPLQPTLEPFAIESLHIFANLPLFAVTFFAWAGVLFYLLFTRSSASGAMVEKVVLAMVLALVFNGFWIIHSPYGFGSDNMANLADVNTVITLGKLPPLADLNYRGYPGAAMLGSFFTQASGLTTFTVGTFFRLELSLLAAALLALFLIRSLKNVRAAMFALVLLVVVAAALSPASVPSRAVSFRADIFSGVFWLAFLALLFKTEEGIFIDTGGKVLALLLLAATTIFYANHSYVIIFVIFSIFIVAKLAKDTRSVEPAMLLFPIVLTAAWSLYVAVEVFQSVTRLLPSFLELLASGEFLFTFQRSVGGPGGDVPFWLPVMSYLRMIFYGLGTLIAVAGLFFLRRLSSLRRREIGAVFGIGAFTLIFMFLEARGIQVTRYFSYVPVFLAPVLIRPVFQLNGFWKKFAVGLLTTVLLAASLPSFLVYYGGNFNTYAVTKQDAAAGEYLQEHFGDIEGLMAYSNRHYSDITPYYLPRTIGKGPREPNLVSEENDLWSDFDKIIDGFNSSVPGLFVFSNRALLLWSYEGGISPDAVQWQSIKDALAGDDGENLVFSNDYVQIYANPVARALSEGGEP